MYVGTSGFSYREWKGNFYPARIKAADMLSYYATRLSTVELNVSFYQNPSEAAVAEWERAVPESFRFAVKAHRRITHARRLSGIEDELELFAALLEGFGNRLGPVLFQLPATAKYVPGVLDRFLTGVPRAWRVAFQFRHPSWHIEPVLQAVERSGGAVCHADGEPEPGPLGRGAFIYLRLRRDRYGKVGLTGWARRIQGYLEAGKDVFAYFKHETQGPRYAQRLVASLRTSARAAGSAAL